MDSLVLSAVSLLCLGVGAAIGFASRSRLPEHHLTRESYDVIRLAAGLLATLVALVLSLLISSANSFYNTVDGEYRESLAGIQQLDDRLKSYGPAAAPARGTLRALVARSFDQHWPGEGFNQAAETVSLADLERQVLALEPRSVAEKWYQAQALETLGRIGHIQSLLRNQYRSQGVPLPLLAVVLLCAAAIFGSFGLYVPANGTILTAISVAGLAVAAAVLLIVELNSPFEGLLRLSSGPAHQLMVTLGR
jgi:hypothetical protein